MAEGTMARRCKDRQAVAGAIAGLVASWTMNVFQSLWAERVGGVLTPPGAHPFSEARLANQIIAKAMTTLPNASPT
jgi:hypothetical protein